MTHTLRQKTSKGVIVQSTQMTGAFKALFIVMTFLSMPAILNAQFGNLLKRTKETVVSKTNNRQDELGSDRVLQHSNETIQKRFVRKKHLPKTVTEIRPECDHQI